MRFVVGRYRAAMAACSLVAFVGLALPAGASALEPGELVVSDVSGQLVVVDPDTGARTLLSSNASPAGGPSFVSPVDVAFEAGGAVLVADAAAFDSGGGVIRVDPDTGARTTVSANGAPSGGPTFVEPQAIAVEYDGDILVADADAEGGTGAIIRVDPGTGARTLLSSNAAPAGGSSFSDPVGLAIETDADILVLDGTAFGGAGGIIRVDRATGVRTTVSENAAPAGGALLVQPLDLALEADGDIVVAQFGIPSVIRVDPSSGARTLVSSNAAPPDPPTFAAPFGIGVEPDGNIVVADPVLVAVLRVDPTSGARSTVSSNATPAGSPTFVSPIRVAVVPSQYSATVLAGDPRGYWRFGEPPGSTTLHDSSGNANHGVYEGGVTLGVPGILADNTAATYDGINDIGRVPDSNTLDVGGSLTLEGWIKRSSTAKAHQLMAKGNAFQLTVMNAGSGNQVWLRKPNVTTLARSNVAIPADGAYHHVVATINGPGSTARIYIDGVDQTDLTLTAPQSLVDTTFPLVFGTTNSGSAQYDEFALYDQVLTPTEVGEHHDAVTGVPM